VFRRTDLPTAPEIPALVEHVAATVRGTTLEKDGIEVQTVEHVLSAISGLGVDDLVVELAGPEPPAMDGSALPFAEALKDSGFEKNSEERSPARLRETVEFRDGGVWIKAIPHDGLAVEFHISYDHPVLGQQSAAFDVGPETFLRDLAPARTYILYEDVEKVRALGLAKGGSTENALVVRRDGYANDGPLRFADEPVRHKIVDLLGDLCLLGRPLEAKITAHKSGHKHHVMFTKTLKEKVMAGTSYTIHEILEILPHRFPFLLVDRILSVEGDKAVGLKNVTYNEPFFAGHFPDDPIMPGVLIVEALAQVAGFLILSRIEDPKTKSPYFSGIENVKFKKPVRPGDQLVLEVNLLRFGGKMAKMEGVARVEGSAVAQATFTAAVLDKE
jgi:UDP-3-O-[3-hydroxymyristoyl] N-acetylglucosamine deacetylase/3-hydroxyacyl-[acyl-carrier-protein] dehydratase